MSDNESVDVGGNEKPVFNGSKAVRKPRMFGKGQKCDVFIEKLELYFAVAGVVEDNNRKIILLTSLEDDVYDLIRCSLKIGSAGYREIVEIIRKAVAPPENVLTARQKFLAC